MIVYLKVDNLETRKDFDDHILSAEVNIGVLDGIHIVAITDNGIVGRNNIEQAMNNKVLLGPGGENVSLSTDELDWINELHNLMMHFHNLGVYIEVDTKKPLNAILSFG